MKEPGVEKCRVVTLKEWPFLELQVREHGMARDAAPRRVHHKHIPDTLTAKYVNAEEIQPLDVLAELEAIVAAVAAFPAFTSHPGTPLVPAPEATGAGAAAQAAAT